MIGDEIVVLLIRGVAAVGFLILLWFLITHRAAQDARVVSRIRKALFVSYVGWTITQGYFMVSNFLMVLNGNYGGYSLQAIGISTVAAVVALTHLWAIWPWRGQK